jgi:hypothetical protein
VVIGAKQNQVSDLVTSDFRKIFDMIIFEYGHAADYAAKGARLPDLPL